MPLKRVFGGYIGIVCQPDMKQHPCQYILQNRLLGRYHLTIVITAEYRLGTILLVTFTQRSLTWYKSLQNVQNCRRLALKLQKCSFTIWQNEYTILAFSLCPTA